MQALWAEHRACALGNNPHARARIAAMPATSQPAAIAPESATTALYRAALGPVNAAHYLAVFERFDEAGRASPAWNPAAGLLTLNWMAFRQLWGAALVYLACAEGLALLVLALSRRFLHWPPSVEWGVLLALLLLSVAIPGAYGNAWLHADTRRRMTRAVREARTVREACTTLEQQASSKRRLWGLVLINALLVAGAVGLYLGFKPATLAALAPTPPAEVSTEPAAPAPAPAAEPAAASATEPAAETAPPAPAQAAAEPEPAREPAPVIVSPPVVAALEPAAPPTPSTPPEPVAPILREDPSPRAEPPIAGEAVQAAPAKTRPPREAPAAAQQAHGINVGLFADPANAEKAHARLVEAGFPAILQKVESPRGERTRVRVGPFAGRAQADEAAARIRAMGLDAVVFAP